MLALLFFVLGVGYAFKRPEKQDSTIHLQRRAAWVSATARRLYDEKADPSTIVAFQKASATLYAAARQSAFHS